MRFSTKGLWCVALSVGLVGFAVACLAVLVVERVIRPRSVSACVDCLQAQLVDSTAKPIFTESAQRAGVKGTVVLSAVVGIDGRLTNIHVIQRLGYGLDEAVSEAVSKWRYTPARFQGRPTVSAVTISYIFK